MNSRSVQSVIAAALVFFAVGTAPVSGASAAEGQEPPPSRGAADVSEEVAREAAAIARKTMSPFCPGRTLSDCPSPNAADWRRDIRKMVADGMSPSEIQDELERRAGGDLSGIPNDDSSYALPIGFAAGAALVLFFVFARLMRKEERAEEAAFEKKTKSVEVDPSEVDDRRLAAELESED